MIEKRLEPQRARAASRRIIMSRQEMSDKQCEALFASTLQESEPVSPEMATAAINRAIERLGPDGCACRMAQEFGDHPEEARDRMRWIRNLSAVMAASPAGREGGAFGCAA